MQFLAGLRNAEPPEVLWGPSVQQAAAFERDLLAAIRKLRRKGKVAQAGAVRELLQRLPQENIAVFKEISCMLNKAVRPEYTKTSKMDNAKFGLCVMPQIQSALCLMIEHYDIIFSDD